MTEKVELILIYGECQRNVRLAARTYAKRYPERYHPPHNYVLRLLQGLSRAEMTLHSAEIFSGTLNCDHTVL